MALIDRLFGARSADALVREHGPAVARLLRRVLGPRADIDDVFQAVFVEVVRSLPTFTGRAQLGTWIHRVTLNVAYQEMRSRYRERARLDDGEGLDELASGAEDAEGAVLRAESIRRVYEGLETLDPRRRIAVILHDLEGRPLREVAELLDRPLQTVASQVKVGRAELARWFRESERVAAGPSCGAAHERGAR